MIIIIILQYIIQIYILLCNHILKYTIYTKYIICADRLLKQVLLKSFLSMKFTCFQTLLGSKSKIRIRIRSKIRFRIKAYLLFKKSVRSGVGVRPGFGFKIHIYYLRKESVVGSGFFLKKISPEFESDLDPKKSVYYLI